MTPNWADNDWDGDGLVNVIGAIWSDPFITPWDHDNDGIRDDIDDDDDADGMKDEDEVMLWPTRFGSESTNPWDHDDFGNGSESPTQRTLVQGPTPSTTTMTQTQDGR